MKENKTNCVIFDLGNVIIKWQPIKALGHIFQDLESMNKKFEEIEFLEWNNRQEFGESREEGLAWAKRNFPDDLEIFTSYVRNINEAHSCQIAGTTKILRELHAKKVPFYGLANATPDGLAAVRHAAPEVDLMNGIVISSDVGIGKPNREFFQFLLNSYSIVPQEALFVDDKIEYCEVAVELGMSCHHFQNCLALEGDLLKRGLL